jgi:hypothetical protein
LASARPFAEPTCGPATITGGLAPKRASLLRWRSRRTFALAVKFRHLGQGRPMEKLLVVVGFAFSVVAGTAVVLTLAPDTAVADWLWQLIA